jgi:hypothetical protein
VSGEADFYDRSFRRIDRTAYILAGIFILGVLFQRGWREALGCAIGALLSFVNLRLWKRVANSIAPDGRVPGTGSATMLGLRYLLLGSIIFVIINYFEVSLLAVLAGLLVSVAAVILEMLYQLVFTSHKA